MRRPLERRADTGGPGAGAAAARAERWLRRNGRGRPDRRCLDGRVPRCIGGRHERRCLAGSRFGRRRRWGSQCRRRASTLRRRRRPTTGRIERWRAPCAAPSDAPGVSDQEITVANIATLSGPIPGLGEAGAAATRAYVAFRNATGGVCGRSVKLLSGDDAQDNGRYRSLVNDFNAKAFAIVGGLSGGDAGGIEIVKNTGIPVVSVPVSLDFHHLPTVFGVNPPYADPNQPTGKYKWLVAQGATKVALVYPGVDQTRAEVNAKHRHQMEASGMKIVLTEEFPLGTLNYDSVARAVANSGADYMLFVSEVGADASMAKSLANTGYDLSYADYLTGYSPKFIDLAGDAAEGSTAWVRVLPNEEAGGNAEQNLFLEWMDKAAPGIAPDVFAADSWVAAKAFFDTLETLPGPITRGSFVDTIRGVKNYDAGGFLGPIQLGPNVTNGCVIGMIVDGGKWRRLAPAKGFLC